jgi:hypothetical protein
MPSDHPVGKPWKDAAIPGDQRSELGSYAGLKRRTPRKPEHRSKPTAINTGNFQQEGHRLAVQPERVERSPLLSQ